MGQGAGPNVIMPHQEIPVEIWVNFDEEATFSKSQLEAAESAMEPHRIQTNTTRMDREVTESEAERDPIKSDLLFYCIFPEDACMYSKKNDSLPSSLLNDFIMIHFVK